MLPVTVPWDLEEMAKYLIGTMEAMRDKNGWSITLNGNGGIIETEVVAVRKLITQAGDERHVQTRDRRRYRLKSGSWDRPKSK